jgi:hypothetical protein
MCTDIILINICNNIVKSKTKSINHIYIMMAGCWDNNESYQTSNLTMENMEIAGLSQNALVTTHRCGYKQR